MDFKSRLLSRFGIIVVIIHIAVGFVIFISISSGSTLTNDRVLKNAADLIHSLAKTTYEFNLERVINNLGIAYYFTKSGVKVNENELIEFSVENQLTHKKERIKIPKMYINKALISNDVKMVDKIQKLVGGTVTIFQVFPKGLLRISTSVRKKSGKRAIGTYIPAKSQVYKTIMQGKTYKGRAFVVTDWYITAYKPLLDAQGKIIGAIYVGVKQTNLNSFKKIIESLKIGKSGYPYIIDRRGEIIFHPEIKGNILALKDIHGKKYIKKIIKLKNGRLSYYYKSGEDGVNREKIVYFRFLKEMKWYIVVSAYSKELFGMVSNLLMIAFIIQAITITTFFALLILKRSKQGIKP